MRKKFWKIFGIVCSSIIITVTLGAVIFFSSFRNSADFVTFDKGKLNEVYTSLTVLDDDGMPLNEPLYLNDYKQIPLSALHNYTYNAFVAVEDKRFFDHNGIDFKRVIGAALHNLKSKSYKEGASTISQQLIKNTHLDNSKTLKRKLNEMMLATDLEKSYSKDEILEMYVNTIYFGRHAYGIESAANVYFNKSAADLTLSESAVLAGMIKAPNVYAPDKNEEKCKARRDTVLKLMLNQNFIDNDAYSEAIAEKIVYNPQTSRSERNYIYHVMQEACRLLNMSPLQLAKSDFVIETYCNKRTQHLLTEMANADTTQTVAGQNADISAIVLNNKGGVEACLLRGETAGTSRQVGSALKPIAVYTPALNEKIITQASPVLDEETDFNGYRPTNAGGYNGWTTVKYAVAKSLNVPAVKTLNALTLPTAQKYLAEFGINGQQNLSLALGNAEGGMDIFTLAKCYAALSNDGQVNETGFIKRIYNSQGLVYSRKLQDKRVFQSGADFLMTDMLLNTVESGTAKSLKSDRFQVAAKTGTVGNADGNTDALVAGYTTENTFVVWYSGDLPNQVNGATAPCVFGRKLLTEIYASSVPDNFTPPSSVVRLSVDKENLYENQLITRCENGEKFWFDKTNQPKEISVQTEYDYLLDVTTEGSFVTVKLPCVNGIWQLYKQTTNKPQKVSFCDNIFREEIESDTIYYAELYEKNKLVYTTPSAKVYSVKQNDNTDLTEENEPPTKWDLPDLTNFWYWG